MPVLGPKPTTFDLSETPPLPASLHPRYDRSARAVRHRIDECKAEFAAAIDSTWRHHGGARSACTRGGTLPMETDWTNMRGRAPDYQKKNGLAG